MKNNIIIIILIYGLLIVLPSYDSLNTVRTKENDSTDTTKFTIKRNQRVDMSLIDSIKLLKRMKDSLMEDCQRKIYVIKAQQQVFVKQNSTLTNKISKQ